MKQIGIVSCISCFQAALIGMYSCIESSSSALSFTETVSIHSVSLDLCHRCLPSSGPSDVSLFRSDSILGAIMKTLGGVAANVGLTKL